MLRIPDYALKAINILEEAGFEAYIVGGCVRDMLMGKEINDIDITTSATPKETKQAFSLFRTIDTGIKHGTVTVIIDHLPLEITTYRIDKGYSDGRRPDSVAFTKSLYEDLARRDFTVNAIAYNPKTGLIDPFDGEYDIKNMIMRCVGDAEKRFTEDSLRILRGLRFSSTLGFTLESETMRAAIECRHLLKNVSAERIYIELSKMLCGKDIRRVLLTYPDIFEEILPETVRMNGFDQKNFHHIYDVWAHTAAVTASIEPVPHLRFAALLHDCGKPDCFSIDSDGVGHFYKHARKSTDKAEAALTRLKSDNFTKERVTQLIKLHDTPIEPDEKVIKKKLGKYGEELFFDLIKLQRADNMGQSPDFRFRQDIYNQIESIAREIIESNQCFSLKDLAVKGNDLSVLGLKGREIGTTLGILLNAVIEGKVENTNNALIEYYHTNVKNR